MQEARKTKGSKNKNTWQINEAIQHKSQYEDEQKYSTTNMYINCPRTMSKRKYFPGE